MSHIPMKMSEEENRDWFSTQVITKHLGDDLLKHTDLESGYHQ